MRRKGMMKGKGRGYKNVIGKDPMVHSQSAKGIKQPQRVIVPLMRVSYGRKDTPIEKREYTMGAGQPVGTIKEFNDFFEDMNVKLELPLTKKEKMKVTDKLKLKDSDKDGVADLLDCQPMNPRKQDDDLAKKIDDLQREISETEKQIEQTKQFNQQQVQSGEKKAELTKQQKKLEKSLEKSKEQLEGIQQESKFKTKLRSGFQKTKEFIKKEAPIVAEKTKELAKAGGEFAVKEAKEGVDFASRKLQERKERMKEQKISELEEVNHPLTRNLEKQRQRVNTIKRHISETTDPKKESMLFSELEAEQEQLREIEEKVTGVNVADLSDAQLKTLAVRHKDTSLFSLSDFFGGSGNEYKDELLRRIDARKKLNRDIAEEQRKKLEPETGLFDDLF